jgi:nitrilase
MLIKVVAVQTELGRPLSLEEKIYIFKQRPDFVCLPEYYQLTPDHPDYHRAALSTPEHLDYLAHLSSDLGTCLIGGTVIEPDGDRLYNTCFIINRGNRLAGYRKRYPVPGELHKGISPGNQVVVYDIEGVKIGLLICGDVFYPELYRELAVRGADVIFIPTTSLYRPADSLSQKRQRDRRYFTSGAETAGAYVVKVCGVGSIFGKPLQGRSLVASPWGMISQVEPPSELGPRILTVTLDIDEIREFRQNRLRRLLPVREAITSSDSVA